MAWTSNSCWVPGPPRRSWSGKGRPRISAGFAAGQYATERRRLASSTGIAVSVQGGRLTGRGANGVDEHNRRLLEGITLEATLKVWDSKAHTPRLDAIRHFGTPTQFTQTRSNGAHRHYGASRSSHSWANLVGPAFRGTQGQGEGLSAIEEFSDVIQGCRRCSKSIHRERCNGNALLVWRRCKTRPVRLDSSSRPKLGTTFQCHVAWADRSDLVAGRMCFVLLCATSDQGSATIWCLARNRFAVRDRFLPSFLPAPSDGTVLVDPCERVTQRPHRAGACPSHFALRFGVDDPFLAHSRTAYCSESLLSLRPKARRYILQQRSLRTGAAYRGFNLPTSPKRS